MRRLPGVYLPITVLLAVLPGFVLADELDDICGTYIRTPIENGWHTGKISRHPKDRGKLQWRNKDGVEWNLIPDLKGRALHTDETNPYSKEENAQDFELIDRVGKVAGFRFHGDTYARDGAKLLTQSGYGLHGYVTVGVEPPPEEFVYGYGFYSNAFPLLERPLGDFQAGLAGTWIIPSNHDFTEPLCPPGTYARDNFHERGPIYHDVFQTIEGSLGFWGSTRFGSATPKYRMNGTPDGYSHEHSSPGWGFGVTEPTADEFLSIAQLSNRLLVPPDGFTMEAGTKRGLMGIAWIALPLVAPVKTDEVTTGDQSWTFFTNTANFSGPVAFWIPDSFSRLSREYKVITGRGLDSRPGEMGGVGMEIASVPCFEARDRRGVLYRRIPQLTFPASQSGQTMLTRDIACYSKQALFDAIQVYHRDGVLPGGTFNPKGVHYAKLNLDKAAFDQGEKNTPIEGTEKFFTETLIGKYPSLGYGLKWNDTAAAGRFPEYFKEVNGKMIAVPAADVPAELQLAEQEFVPPPTPQAYTSPEGKQSVWKKPGPRGESFEARLTDGSVVTYAWYRFADQPSIVAQKWSQQKRERLQKLVEKIHAQWKSTDQYLPPPSTDASLVSLDRALLVTPPEGLEVGYVPIATRQAAADGKEGAPGKRASGSKLRQPPRNRPKN